MWGHVVDGWPMGGWQRHRATWREAVGGMVGVCCYMEIEAGRNRLAVGMLVVVMPELYEVSVRGRLTSVYPT